MSGTNYEYLLEEYLNYNYSDKVDPNDIRKIDCNKNKKEQEDNFEVPF